MAKKDLSAWVNLLKASVSACRKKCTTFGFMFYSWGGSKQYTHKKMKKKKAIYKKHYLQHLVIYTVGQKTSRNQNKFMAKFGREGFVSS